MSPTGPVSRPGRGGRRHRGAQTVFPEMSAGLKDTSRGPEGGAGERQRGEERREGANIWGGAFSTQLPFDATSARLVPADVLH